MKKYIFKPYSPIFPELFLKEKERIIAQVSNILSIEHVGSTAVVNLGGKGIIDIAISADESTFDSLTQQIHELGYQLKPFFGRSNRLFFRADLPDFEEGLRRYHIHVTAPGSKDWSELILFRDYLKTHPDVAQRYAGLKKSASESVNDDGELYRALKAPFFEEIRILHHSSP